MTAPTITLPDGWRSWDPEVKRRWLFHLQAQQAGMIRGRWNPYPWQRPHEHPEDRPPGVCTPACADYPTIQLSAHELWLVWGGRGIGKTDVGANYVLDHVAGPPCDKRARGGHRIAIVAPTLGDAVESCVTGLSGIQAYDPRVTVTTSLGGTYVNFPGKDGRLGPRAKVFGAHTETDVDRLRAGGNRCLVWLEELAAMRYLGGVLEHVRLGLRVGTDPHMIGTSTPRTRPEVRELLDHKRSIITRGRTRDAHHLDAQVLRAYEEQYAGTTIGMQELEGLLLENVEGALWRRWLIDRSRIKPGMQPELRRIVVAVDPNAGGPDEAGITVTGVGRDLAPDRSGHIVEHGYLLADYSDHFAGSEGWARMAVQAYHTWKADAIVAEVNNGGDMVGLTVRAIDPTVRYRSVTATRGKARRAEPVVALYEQDRMHHVGAFPKLEDQMTTWTEDAAESPDRMDSLVWGATDLLLAGPRGFAGAA